MAEYLHNKEQNGIEIYFDGKPDADILALLKTYKWRWNPKKSCWYHKYSKENEDFARAVIEDKNNNNSEQVLLEELSTELDEMIKNHKKTVERDEIVMGRLMPVRGAVTEEERRLKKTLLKEPDAKYTKGKISPIDRGSQKLETVIDEKLLEVVNDVIHNFGIEILNNRVKAPSIFSDLLVSFGKEKHIVRMAIREGMIAKILSVATDYPVTQRTTLIAATEYMHEELGMDYKSSCAVLMTFQAAINKATPNVWGKSTCHKLKEMRRIFAEANGIEFFEEECTYEGPCNGTCSYCDSKTKELSAKVKLLKKNSEITYPSVDIGVSNREGISDDELSCGTVPVLIEQGRIEEEDLLSRDIETIGIDGEDLPFN